MAGHFEYQYDEDSDEDLDEVYSEWCENCSGIGEQFPMVICSVCGGTGVKGE